MNLKSLRCTHIAGTSELSCAFLGKAVAGNTCYQVGNSFGPCSLCLQPKSLSSKIPIPCHHFYIRNQRKKRFPLLSSPPASIRCRLSKSYSTSTPLSHQQDREQAQETLPFQSCGTNFRIPFKIPPCVLIKTPVSLLALAPG